MHIATLHLLFCTYIIFCNCLVQVLADFDGVCNGDISIVQPRPKDMYTRDICSSVGWWTGKDTDTATENTHLSVPPIVVKR